MASLFFVTGLLLMYLTSSINAQWNPYYCSKYADDGWNFDLIPPPCRCGGMNSIDIAEFGDGRRILSFEIGVFCGGVSRLEDIQKSWQSGYFAPPLSEKAKSAWNITGIQVNLTQLSLGDAGPEADDARLQWNDLLNTPFKRGKDSDVVVKWLFMEKLRKLPSDNKNPKSILLNSTKFRELEQLRFTASANDVHAVIPNDMFVVGNRTDIPSKWAATVVLSIARLFHEEVSCLGRFSENMVRDVGTRVLATNVCAGLLSKKFIAFFFSSCSDDLFRRS